MSRELALISQDAKKDSDKIAAIDTRYQIELDILNVGAAWTAAPLGTRYNQVRSLNVASRD